ncbi:hypothetical protein [Propionivibrio sp.]|uniref:hypothetical protein n=1 Tax=Propionivibrio sp. TaxID=2212460 RepID=UPI003BF40030
MPIPWLVVLQSVPWVEVMSNAPKVAEGAKKLWKAIARKSPPAEAEAPIAEPDLSPEDQSIATLQARLAAVEASAADLHDQMLASSELIKALAEQNTQLINRIEANRVRVLWLAGFAACIAVISVVGLVLALAR